MAYDKIKIIKIKEVEALVKAEILERLGVKPSKMPGADLIRHLRGQVRINFPHFKAYSRNVRNAEVFPVICAFDDGQIFANGSSIKNGKETRAMLTIRQVREMIADKMDVPEENVDFENCGYECAHSHKKYARIEIRYPEPNEPETPKLRSVASILNELNLPSFG